MEYQLTKTGIMTIITHKNTSKQKYGKHNKPIIIHKRSHVAMQHEDSELWTHSTIMEHEEPSNNSGSYEINVTETECITTRNLRHVKRMPLAAKQYL